MPERTNCELNHPRSAARFQRAVFVLAVAAIICPRLALGVQESADAAAQVSPLVDVDWLEKNIPRADVRVIDLAHRVKNYNQGHIPGAAFVDWRSDIIDQSNTDSYTMPPQEQFEELMGRLGVRPADTLVLTDNMDSRAAVRMYLTLKYFGHDRACVLDGGTDAWKSAGGEVTTDVPELPASEYRIGEVREAYLTSLESVRAAIEDETVVIDGRPTNQYTGEAPGKVFHTGREHKRRGHISSAVNIPWAENLNDDGTFKSLDQLKAMYADSGMGEDDSVMTYCNEGLHATVPWFVLHELLGRENVQVYDLSMFEWANRDDTEMTEGDK